MSVPLALLVLLAVVVWWHEIAVLRRARSASEALNNNKTRPARLERRAADQHR